MDARPDGFRARSPLSVTSRAIHDHRRAAAVLRAAIRRPAVSAAVRRIALLTFFCLTVPHVVLADVFRPAYLELKQRDADTFDVLWKVPAVGDTMRLGIHVRFPAGTTNVTEPRGTFVTGAFVERWTIRRPGGLA